MGAPQDNIIQSLWIGSRLSVLETLSIRSFIAHGHPYHLYVYDDLPGIPDGVSIMDANEIIPRSEIFRLPNGSLAAFADWFRWELLYLKGHYWVDTDMICVRPFVFDEAIIFGKQGIAKACPAVLHFEPRYSFCRIMADACASPNRFQPYDNWPHRCLKTLRTLLYRKQRRRIFWGEAGGPAGFTRALEHYGMFNIGKPFTVFYPIHWTNWRCIFDETLKDDLGLFSDTRAIHLWNEMLRREPGFDKNAQFPQHSLIERLKSIYL